MTEYKKSNEIKKYLKSKKRKKRIKKISMITIILTIALILFITKAPIFNIKSIEITGTSKISSDNLKENLNMFIGENIYVVNEEEIKNILLSNQYIKDVKISRKGISNLVIEISEESPVFYIENNGFKYIINEDLEVIEEVEDIQDRNVVKISGIEYSNIVIGEKINDDIIYPTILKIFYPYIAQNRESIKFDEIDISDIVNIKGRIGNVEIYFGDDSDIHNKMENIYRIMLSEEINITNGYIDVSFDGPPIIKNITN